MNTFLNILAYIKGVFWFKKFSYVILSFILTLAAALSTPITSRIIEFLKHKLNTDEVILAGSISIGVFCVTFIVVLFELITGIMAFGGCSESKKNSKILEWIFKEIFYGIWVFIIFSFQIFSYMAEHETIIGTLKYIMFFSAVLINSYELKSASINLENRFGKTYKIFKFLDFITGLLEKTIGTYIENTLCKIKEKSQQIKDEE